MPKISVIVPIYNVEPYLRRCIDSIINQTYQDLEIILVDDGSPDNCPAICDEYAILDTRVKVVHQKNGGLPAARNTGLALSTGEFISFVDSDDILHCRYCEYLLSAAETHTADIAFCGFHRFTSDTNLTDNTHNTTCLVMNGNTATENLFSIWYQPNVFNKLIRRSLFDSEALKFPSVVRAEDLYLTYFLLTKAKTVVGMKYCNLYYYRKTPQSIMSKLSPRHIGDDLSVRLEVYEKIFKDRYPVTAKKFADQTLYIFQDFALSAFSSKNKEIKRCVTQYARTLVKKMWMPTATTLIEKLLLLLLYLNVDMWTLCKLILHKLLKKPLYVE